MDYVITIIFELVVIFALNLQCCLPFVILFFFFFFYKKVALHVSSIVGCEEKNSVRMLNFVYCSFL